MLIYNHQQEFVGINEKDLKSLGFRNLADLQNECKDFADLFVKRPTYIHNFKNFNWIYYILNSDIPEAKVIINAKNREFSATIEIETIYLNDAPSQIAYAITLAKLKALDGREIEESKLARAETPTGNIDFESEHEYMPGFENEKGVVLSEPDPFETPPVRNIINDPYDFDFNAPLEVEDLYVPSETHEEQFDIGNDFAFAEFDEQTKDTPTLFEEPKVQNISDEKVKTKPMLGDYTISSDSTHAEYINNLHVSKDYVYNPQVASDELGLPVDLIEEFIGDFIQQSYDFKEELYTRLANDELSDLKLLSHKLKGVAANLRIEDAFEVLSIINTSSNMDEIRATLDHFYKIISKLEGKELPIEPDTEKISDEKISTAVKTSNEEEDDLFLLKDFDKEEETVQAPAHQADGDDIYDISLMLDEEQPANLQESPLEILDIDDLDNFVGSKEEFYKIPEEINSPAEDLETLDYDKSAAVNELGLPSDLIEELLGDFKEQAQSRLKVLETAVETNDKTALYDTVMNIKGTADNLRVTKISQVLKDLLFVTDKQEMKQLLIRLKNFINQL
ncbi:MAG: hypothetical protein PHX13_02390 [Thiovulaceae bacterium]|nr:hypothetical protein [Sulfurimonadaceae bacterium]